MIRRRIASITLLLLTAHIAHANPSFAQQNETDQPKESIDWDSARDEAADLLSQYIRINTKNPPGREIVAARWLRDHLVKEGVEFLLIDQGEGKAALLGRIEAKAEPKAGAIVLLNHMDVVEASREHWSVDPFEGRIRDGYVWGRGALDMKGTAIVELMAIKLLARHGPPLRRDIIFLATSDEEIVGGVDAGRFVAERADLLEGAEYLINEGGTIRVDDQGQLLYYGVGVTEKSPFWHKLSARGIAGHGSQPIAGSAVNRLVDALTEIRAWETPIKLTPPVAEFFRRLAEIAPEEDAALYRDIPAALRDPEKRARLLSDRYHNAILRNTISITRLAGSNKTNVIPPVAEAELDMRLLPGENPEAFLEELKRRAGVDDGALTIESLGATWPATASPSDSELFQAIETLAKTYDPGSTVLPYVLAGFTDSHYFRNAGIKSYGVGFFKLSSDESARIHGNDERVSVENLGFGTRFLYELLVKVGS